MALSPKSCVVPSGMVLALLAPLVHAQLMPSSSAPSLTLPTAGYGQGYAGTPGSLLNLPPQLFTYGADVGVGETDNVTLASTDKVSQTIAITDLDFTVNEQSRLLAAQARGDFSFLDYLQGAYGTQLIGRFDGSGAFALLPEHVLWILQDDYGQAALNPYVATTPNNLENVNYFTTGPKFMTRFGALNFATLDLRYSRATFSGTPFDSNRASAALAFGREISAGAAVSLNVTSERVMFQDTSENTDFLHSSAFARYQLNGARTNVEVDLGATKINDSPSTIVTPAVPGIPAEPGVPAVPGAPATPVFTPAHSNTGPLAKISLSRLVSPTARVTLSGGRELTDASSSFSSLQSGAIGTTGTAAAIQSTGSYTSTFGSAAWTYEKNRTTIALTGRWEKDVYLTQDVFNLTTEGAELNAQRRLTQAFTGQIIGRYYKSDYPNALALVSPGTEGSTDYIDSTIGFGLSWRHGRALQVRLIFAHDTHEVRNGVGAYHDNRAYLTVGYRPFDTPLPEEALQTP